MNLAAELHSKRIKTKDIVTVIGSLTFCDGNIILESVVVVVSMSNKLQNWDSLIFFTLVFYIVSTNNGINKVVVYLMTVSCCDDPLVGKY